MRLVDLQLDTIRTVILRFLGNRCRVYLFGSRLNEKARGGDVDLLIETPQYVSRMQRARLKIAIEAALELPVDLVIRSEDETPTAFQRIAKSCATSIMDGRKS